MDIIYSDKHHLRNAKTELYGGTLVEPFECPRRAEIIRARCIERGIGEIIPPRHYADLPLALHAPDYVEFIRDCWDEWQAAGCKGEAIASCWPSRGLPRQIAPREIDGRIGYYAMAAETTISEGTYEAALASADVAATGAALLLEGKGAAFSLCRPPGHHAATDLFGGYCFFNNAALAAQHLRSKGAKRVAIFDVDFHHGNGTQEIFYRRDDVLFLSIHGEPAHAFPYFLGYDDERGEGQGADCNVNYPLPPQTDFGRWREAFDAGCARIAKYAPDFLVVSLGVDTYLADPISFFKLASDDFTTYGEAIGRLNIDTLFVMEGGYAVDEIGINTVNVLEGFAAARP